MTTTRVLAICDLPGWAFDRNVRDMAAALAEHHEFRFWYMRDGQPPPDVLSRADVIYCAYRWDIEMPENAWRHAVGSLRCEFFDTEYPGLPATEDVACVRRFGGGFHAVTSRAADELHALGCDGVRYLTNPVDLVRAGDPTNVRDRVVASWSGHARHPHPRGLDVKGFETVVLPAVRSAGVEFQYAERVTRPVHPSRMPDFYRRANVTLCASLWEGASNSVMEAMAAGHAVIATDCGNHREMVESELEHMGESGIVLVPRTPEAFADALAAMTPERAARMGEINRQEIRARWGWDAWRVGYADLLAGAVNRSARARV